VKLQTSILSSLCLLFTRSVAEAALSSLDVEGCGKVCEDLKVVAKIVGQGL
jgi:hypothetical protein